MSDEPGLFDFVRNIMESNDNMMENDDLFVIGAYSPFAVNMALSQYPETLFYANEMNRFPSMDKRQHYDYLRLSIRKGKKWTKWVKKTKREDEDRIALLMEAYKYSRRRAIEILDLLTDEDFNELEERYYTGGFSGKR